MAVETVNCGVCHGSGKERFSFPERTAVCSLGFTHTMPRIVAGTPCHECGGSGTVVEANFGRQ